MRPKIDAWGQHPTLKFISDPVFDSLKRWGSMDSNEEIPVDTTVACLDSANVETMLISAWCSAHSGWMIRNEDVATVVRTAPTRFRGVASFDMRATVNDSIREIRHYVQKEGFVGVRYLSWLWDLPPTHRKCYPIYAELVELDVPLCLQVGHTGPLRTSEYGRPIPYVEQIALDFPDLKIVCGHIGLPWIDDMIFLCRKFENVYIDTSAYKPSIYPKELIEFMKSKTGRKKVLFGSNYPMILHPQLTDDSFNDLNLPEDTLDDFFYNNASRIFKLKSNTSKL